MSSSLRESPLEHTLERAREMAARLGITRVTDTTRLDRIGIPVFASIRPSAIKGSLCVNAGKGLRPQEARVGAYMEAIEFAMAEPRGTRDALFSVTARELESRPGVRYRLVDLCPKWGVRIDPNQLIACVNARDDVTGQSVPIPAALVFVPFRENPHADLFGSSSNGLASGNSIREAQLHGLCEVVERHVQAFNLVKSVTTRVDIDELIPTIAPLQEKIETAGLRLVLRHAAGPGGLPYFNAFILEQANEGSTLTILQEGSALHLRKEIAAVRAIAEAVQSRLTFIHGGRDDLIDWFTGPGVLDHRKRTLVNERARAVIEDATTCIRYSEIGDLSECSGSIDEAWEALKGILLPEPAKQILTVELTDSGSPLAVVKVIVPGLESFEPVLKRAGPRLMEYVDAL